MTSIRNEEAFARLRAGRWFRDLPTAFADAIMTHGNLVKVPAGRMLFARGHTLDAMYGVVDGKLRAVAVDDEGREALLSLVEAPNWVGEIPFFDGLPRTHDLIAESDSVVLRVPAPALKAWLEAHPIHWRDFSKLLTNKLRVAFTALEDHAVAPLATRLARRLVWLADGYAQWVDRTHRVVDVNQETLASMLSTSRQSINRELRRMTHSGFIRSGYGGIEVIDLDALRRAARGRTREIALTAARS